MRTVLAAALFLLATVASAQTDLEVLASPEAFRSRTTAQASVADTFGPRVFLDPSTLFVVACRKWSDVEVFGPDGKIARVAVCNPGDVDQTFRALAGYVFVRVAAGSAQRVEILYDPSLTHSSTFWPASFKVVDGWVTLPVAVAGPQSSQRIAVITKMADGTQAEIISPMQKGMALLALPKWTERQ